MFIGEYSAQVGDKNRIAIPKRIRDLFIGDVIITRGYEKSLLMTDSRKWTSLISEMNKSPLFSLKTREMKRFILGGAFNIEYDSQGRFVLPEQLKEYSSINEKVIFLGVGEWVEIWDETVWGTKLKTLDNQISLISDNLLN